MSYVGLCTEDSKPMLGRRLSRKTSQADAEPTHVKLETKDEDEKPLDHEAKPCLERVGVPVAEGMDDAELELRQELKREVKRERCAVQQCRRPRTQLKAKLEVKQEPKLEVKDEASKGISCITPTKAEGTVKREAGGSTKTEPKLEIKREAGDTKGCVTPIKAKVEVKREPGVVVKREAGGRLEYAAEADWGYAARVPLWVKQCLAFQQARRTWSPARICCVASCFLNPLGPPGREGEPVSCIHRLTKDQRRQLRAYVESEEAERPISDTVTRRSPSTPL
jgi:hypothetical protein